MPPLALLNPAPLMFAIATTFGVLMHDTKIDHATKIAISAPAPFAEYSGSETNVKTTSEQPHVHVEKVSIGQVNAQRSVNPRTQVRDDDHKYVQPKRLIGGGDDKTTLWPSI